MGVYLCLGQQIYEVDKSEAKDFKDFKTFENIQDYLEENEKVFIFLGEGIHKIKKKAEQIACNEALQHF